MKFLRKKASTVFALPTIVAICGDHDKLWDIVRPRYFIESTLCRVCSLILYGHIDGHGLLVTIRCSHFVRLKGICQMTTIFNLESQ